MTCLIFIAHIKLNSGQICSPLDGGIIHLSTTSSITLITGVSGFTDINDSSFTEVLWDKICDRLELKKLRWREIKIKDALKFLMIRLRQLGPGSSAYLEYLTTKFDRKKIYRKVFFFLFFSGIYWFKEILTCNEKSTVSVMWLDILCASCLVKEITEN